MSSPEYPEENSTGELLLQFVGASKTKEELEHTLTARALSLVRGEVGDLASEPLNESHVSVNPQGSGSVIVMVPVYRLSREDAARLRNSLRFLPDVARVEASGNIVTGLHSWEVIIRGEPVRGEVAYPPDQRESVDTAGAVEAVAAATRDTAGQVQPGSH